MNNLQKLFAATILASSISLAGNAVETQVETYAHPTLFGSQAHSYATTKANYVVGGEVQKDVLSGTIGKKNSVYVDGMADAMLNTIRNAKGDLCWNPKMPVLRSELAVILAETFAPSRAVVKGHSYKDINNKYWANSWITTATKTNLMIGYPDKTFKPDQPVTKAEVFATIAQIVDVDYSNVKAVTLNEQPIKYIPMWSVNATKEVIATKLLNNIKDTKKVINDEYLSKAQVAYLICDLKAKIASGEIKVSANAPAVVKACASKTLTIKMNSRVSAKHSNVNELFTAKTTTETTINGEVIPVGSTVTGRVVEVKRPGLKHPGYVKVKFEKITNDNLKVEFPSEMSEAVATTTKNPNFVARVFGAPFSATGRVAGVVGRSGAQALNVATNRVEELGDDTSDLFVETLCLHPGSGVKSAGNGLLAIVKGSVDVVKSAVSGTFGVAYELCDELVYLVLPSKSNNSALNPDEVIEVRF